MARKKKNRRRGAMARLVEALGAVTLFLVVLVFAASIVDRYGRSAQPGVRVEWPPRSAVQTSDVDDGPISIEPARTPLRSIIDGPASERAIIKVLNGSGEDGLAREMTAWLRKSGFDVVDLGNADREDYETTQVIDRSGRGDSAERVTTALRAAFDVGELRRDPMEEPDVDICIVVGRDLARAWSERRTSE